MFSSQEGHLYIGAGLLYHIVSQRGLQQLALLKLQNQSKKIWEEKNKKKEGDVRGSKE